MILVILFRHSWHAWKAKKAKKGFLNRKYVCHLFSPEVLITADWAKTVSARTNKVLAIPSFMLSVGRTRWLWPSKASGKELLWSAKEASSILVPLSKLLLLVLRLSRDRAASAAGFTLVVRPVATAARTLMPVPSTGFHLAKSLSLPRLY